MWFNVFFRLGDDFSYSDTFAGSTVLSNLTQTKYWLHFQWNGCDDAALLLLLRQKRCCLIITEAVYVWKLLCIEYALSHPKNTKNHHNERMRARVVFPNRHTEHSHTREATGNDCSWARPNTNIKHKESEREWEMNAREFSIDHFDLNRCSGVGIVLNGTHNPLMPTMSIQIRKSAHYDDTHTFAWNSCMELHFWNVFVRTTILSSWSVYCDAGRMEKGA